MSLNACTISGHLGKSAELRMTGSGLAVVSFTVAVNERQRQQDGSYSDYTNWFDCTMFGKRAEGLQGEHYRPPSQVFMGEQRPAFQQG